MANGEIHADRRAFRFLQLPCHSLTWFLVDLLTIILVSVAIFAALFAFGGRDFMVTLVEFTGSAIPLIVAVSILATTFTMILLHARHILAGHGSFVLPGVVALVLALGIGAAIGYTVFEAKENPLEFGNHVLGFISFQAILVVVAVLYSSVLKADLMLRIYEFTTHAGIAYLESLKEQDNLSKDGYRDWLSEFGNSRRNELRVFDELYAEHLAHLRKAGRSR